MDDLLKIASQQWMHLKLKGKSVKYNQLAKLKTASYTSQGVTSDFSNNIAHIHGTATNTGTLYLTDNYSIVATHKYYTSVKGFNKQGSYGSTPWILTRFQNGPFYTEDEKIVNGGTDYSGNAICYIQFYAGNVIDMYISLQFIDLTDLFGTGNEPTTLDQFYATDIGKLVKAGYYLPYAPNGAIKNVKAPFVFESRNLCDNKFEQGRYDLNTGEKAIGYVGYYRTKTHIEVKPGITYYLSRNERTLGYLYEYDENKAFLGNTYISTDTQNNLILSSQTKYINIALGSSLTSEPTNVLLQEATESNTTYTPYRNIEYSRTKRVDLGTISDISYDATNTRFILRATLNNKPTTSATDIPNMICSGYTTVSANVFDYQLPDKAIRSATTSNIIYIRDTRYTNVADFKNAMSGVILDYEPTEQMELASANDISDTWQNTNGKDERKLGVVDLGSLNYFITNSTSGIVGTVGLQNIIENGTTQVLCSKFVYGNPYVINECIFVENNGAVDIRSNNFIGKTAQEVKSLLSGTILIYPLATPTTETAPSIMLPNNITKCTDADGMEVEFEVLNDSLNFSNKTLVGKASPTITAEKIITKGFTSAGTHYAQMYVYADGEVWYVNSGNHATAFANNVWEIEYKTIKFDSGVELTREEKDTLLKIYDKI